MKKVFPLCVLVLAVSLASCGYSKEDLINAKNEGYQTGFENGYDLAKYESKGELEEIKIEYSDAAYEAGYETGYEDGYYDCLKEQGLITSTFDPNNVPRIEKDRD